MSTQTSLQNALQNVQVDPILERFLGGIVLGRLADEVAGALDKIELQEVPVPLRHLVQIWQGRNRAPEAQEDVIHLLQDTLKEMLP
ncbi:MAG TPA: hypothetical protein VLA72_15205 [Anaerolineales bacterium]|nr:hypothetical protein [Anaerolineales bacterium]